MKKIYLLYVFIITLYTPLILPQVIIDPAENGINLSPTSPNVSGAWATLDNIIITEHNGNDGRNDFAIGDDVTLILTAPNNWQFKENIGHVVAQYLSGGGSLNLSNVSINVAKTTLTITFDVTNDDARDQMIISGIQVTPIDRNITPSLGQILRTGGTANIEGGAVSDNLNYGNLSLDQEDPLPIQLNSFTASINNYSVYLIWHTLAEVDNYGFEVERSADGMKWENVGFVKGNGNSNSEKEYEFIDNVSLSGNYLYRLKQIDTDGGFEYSEIIEVDINILTKFMLTQNYPNPFNPNTTIKFAFEHQTKADLKVYDALGNEVVNLFHDIAEAGRIYEVNFNSSLTADGLSSGVYYYRLTGDNKVEMKKMLLLK